MILCLGCPFVQPHSVSADPNNSASSNFHILLESCLEKGMCIGKSWFKRIRKLLSMEGVAKKAFVEAMKKGAVKELEEIWNDRNVVFRRMRMIKREASDLAGNNCVRQKWEECICRGWSEESVEEAHRDHHLLLLCCSVIFLFVVELDPVNGRFPSPPFLHPAHVNTMLFQVLLDTFNPSLLRLPFPKCLSFPLPLLDVAYHLDAFA